jgi:hypothetical protein
MIREARFRGFYISSRSMFSSIEVFFWPLILLLLKDIHMRPTKLGVAKSLRSLHLGVCTLTPEYRDIFSLRDKDGLILDCS